MFHFDGAGRGDLAVAALVDGNVYDDRARLHGLDHLLCDQDGSDFAGDQSGKEDNVHILNGLGQDGALFFQPLIGKLVGVTALADGDFWRNAQVDNFGSQALGLLAGVGADISGVDDGAQTLGGCHGLEAGDTGAEDQHVGGLNHADSAEDLGNEFGQGIGGHDHAFISSAGAHGGQRVHALCSGNTGDTVQSQGDDLFGGHFLDHFMVDGGSGVDEGDQVLAFMHHIHFVEALCFVKQRLFYLQNDVGFRKDFRNVIHQGGARFCIQCIGEVGFYAGAFFKQDGRPVGHQFFHRLRGCGNAAFTMHNFLWNTDDHNSSSL